ncbi:helix-turn-helix domain-containing protein [Pseudogracilibacillus auburnensis]|uniref:XRE family transcriptional regulator n=1 Tax=Pseudogracilibacillus auburnensis TaxID=1494959 RepID=A0A2V3WPP5_9BACI|nr:XRE family transcriptional regulator [Pseudogracilibacillus auburnensis]MBO1001257.1 helix-turn-helix transcriptional regulator [Pseudogracilibacillus auburnensis]PXW90689.1 XRE family transcriptional regulator [Pseudogracilibacillus auburnensis]
MSTEFPWNEKNIGERIGKNLRQFRSNKGISIEAFANQIGVSKLTLIKIEKGEGNPTLSVIWKIADGLKIPITSLLSMESTVSIARKQDGVKLMSNNKKFIAEPLFRSHGFELYRGYLQPEAEYASEAHQKGVREFVTVMSGKLHMEIDGETYELDEHDSIQFEGDRPHIYHNPTTNSVILHFVISYNHQ